MKNFFYILFLLSTSSSVFAQKASDVLENGIRVGTDNVIIYKYDPVAKILKYGITRSLNDITQPVIFLPTEDASLYLCNRNAANIYVRPLNPLNYSFGSNIEILPDPINETAATALGTIINSIPGANTGKVTQAQPDKIVNGKNVPQQPLVIEVCTISNDIERKLQAIENALKSDKKNEINSIFKSLKELDFKEENLTVRAFDKIKVTKEPIDDHFKDIDKKLTEVQTLVSEYKCEKMNGEIVRMQLNLIVQNFSNVFQEQSKRLKNLQVAFELVEKEILKASSGDGESGLKWCVLLEQVPTKSGKIANHNLQVFEQGYVLSGENEITASPKKEIFKTDSKFRRFQRFVPEVSVGTAYTFFEYYEYGTTTDDTGQQFVANPTEKEIKNLNITTMVNFTYYIENSSVHPFWQVGAGLNAEIPTLLTGFGLRGVLGTNRLTISGGIAMTWIKELNDLKVGDPISGTADIENDLKHTFTWPPKPYIGLQYNF